MAMRSLLLHAHEFGPNPIKIAIACESLKLPYDIKLWEFGDDQEKGVKGAKFLKINENGRVPALEDPNTGVLAWESGAIMNYLRRKYDQPRGELGPKGSSEQAKVDFDKWEYFLVTTLAPMNGQVNWFRHFQKNEDALNRYTQQTYRCFEVLDGQLARMNGESILPGGITAVDYHYEPWLRLYGFGGLSLDKYPNVAKWLKLMNQRDEVKAAYQRFRNAAR